MTAPTSTPQEIARRLSPAQRKALKGWYVLNFNDPSASAEALGVKVPTMDALNFARLCVPTGRGHLTAPRQAMWCLTPLGLLVRAELERMEARMGDPIIERPSEKALMRLALAKVSQNVPSVKGMEPKDQVRRLRAELELRIKIARDALRAQWTGDHHAD